MRAFLTKPRSIVGSTLWGIIVAVSTFALILVASFLWSLVTENYGPSRQVESIAVGSGYSISFDAKPAHPFLAEYTQSIRVYGGTFRGGEELGRIEIPMNTGGRVRIGVLVVRDPAVHQIVLVDRKDITLVDLETLSTSSLDSWHSESYEAIGVISGESFPIKYFSCSIVRLMGDSERAAVLQELDHGDEGFCNAI